MNGRAYRVVAELRPRRRLRAGSTEHVIHVGYHKTASTWLQVCVFPYVAGFHYGDPLLGNFIVNLASAADHTFFAAGFRSVLRQIEAASGGPLLLSYEGLSGSLWDGYGTGLRNAARLHTIAPCARILLVVRRQDEMLRSVHAQYVNEGGTQALREFVDSPGVEGSRFSLRHLEYDRLATRYVELFGRDRVWVIPYEYLRAQRQVFLEDLCAFLGSGLTANISRAQLNHSLSGPSLWLLRTWNRLFRVSRFNSEPLLRPLPGGRRMRNLMQRRVDPIVRWLAPERSTTRDARLLDELAADFAASNQRLQRYCPRSLATWGYRLPAGSG